MGIKLDHDLARARLLQAVEWAADDTRPVPEAWIRVTERVGESSSKTLVAVLGTGLLARATDDRADAMSLKERFSETSHDARSLCHKVLVPVSKDGLYPFHLGARGREPLNNQPFFRFDHLTVIDVTRTPEDLRFVRTALSDLNNRTSDYALAALAAFVRSRAQVQQQWNAAVREMVPDETEVAALLDELADFLREGTPDRPLRLQAVVGGLVRLTEQPVSVQAVHDPSRHAPGDVHVPDEREPHWAAEVRGKPVPLHEAIDFVERCASWGSIRSCWVVVAADDHAPLDRGAVSNVAHERGMLAIVIEDLLELVAVIAGHPSVKPVSLDQVATAVLHQLASMRAEEVTLNDWRARWA